ncbi:AAA family ATPase [Thomasclavelia cocleata]|uniref:AAA family ATPase n=1 Tax=Thomasclavelia cocleata TaxID=69824 RepID=UPI002575314D|nr:AAA family ATPase [Thomasclavelia cocleata]
MKFVIQKISIFTTDGEKNVFSFSNTLTFIYGNFGTGKSTLLDLIVYSLGGNLTYTPAINNCFEAVQLEVKLNNKPFRFFRRVKSNRIQVDDMEKNQRYSLTNFQISSFIYKQYALPELYLSMGNIEDRKVKLTFANFLWFSYLKQSEMDNCFFYLNSDNIFKQNAAINVLLSFFESEFILNKEVNQRYRDLKRRLRQYEDSDKVFEYLEKIFIRNNEVENTNMEVTISELKKQIASALNNIENFNRDSISRLLDMQKKLDELEYRVAFELRRARYYMEIEKLRKEMEGKSRHIYYDKSMMNSNVQLLYNLFLDCLVNIGFQGVSKFDTMRIDPITYMPILTNTYENREVSFDNIGSGGKKTLFKICFALAIHRLQHAKQEDNYLPSFLIIDTPMKNISEREDACMYDKFYHYLFTLLSTELSDTQLIVVDKECKDLSKYKFTEEVVLMRMTHEDGMNPPLFKNYKGL